MSEQRGDRAAQAVAHDADAADTPRASRDPHAPDAREDAGRPGDAPTDHGDREHDAEVLGPVDVAAWAAGAVGVALGLVVALCMIR